MNSSFRRSAATTPRNSLLVATDAPGGDGGSIDTEHTSSRMPTPPATLLLVDDDRDFVASLEMLLPTLGYTVIPAHSVREALDVLDTSSVDVVISDIRMPEVDGLDLVRVLRHRFPRLPTVLLTGAPPTDEDVIPREAKRVLLKPVAIAELQRAIADLLNARVP
jgi:CheY-like chemotaxis protein